MKVVAPSTPSCAKGLLKASIRDDNPVIFTENPGLYGIKGEVPEDPDFTIPFGKARIAKEGKHISLIAYSRMVHVCEAAAEELAKSGIDAEIVDVRCLLPLDTETIFFRAQDASGSRCLRRLEEWWLWSRDCCRIGQECFDDLDAPVGRVGGLNVPTPYSRVLELQCIPNEKDVIAEVQKIG